jgi:hypothetical protein
MRLHVDLLGYFHSVWGAFGVLTGASLALLAAGTALASRELGTMGAPAEAAIWMLGTGAAALGGLGGAMLVVGHALRGRRGRGRTAALLLAVPNLVVAPFGTALGVYTFWVLQNDDARGQFGRPAQRPAPRSTWTPNR